MTNLEIERHRSHRQAKVNLLARRRSLITRLEVFRAGILSSQQLKVEFSIIILLLQKVPKDLLDQQRLEMKIISSLSNLKKRQIQIDSPQEKILLKTRQSRSKKFYRRRGSSRFLTSLPSSVRNRGETWNMSLVSRVIIPFKGR